jgi:hypothetical protein
MHTAWLTLICVVGVGQPALEPGPDGAPVPSQCCPGPPRDPGETCFKALTGWFADWFTPMPQTCYSPRFGCYPGASRTLQRYPAFHGTYYRRAYNYRQLYEWPWLAEPHEPDCCLLPCAAQCPMPPVEPQMTPQMAPPMAEELPVPGMMPAPAHDLPAPATQPK